jgi:hypothetical protein
MQKRFIFAVITAILMLAGTWSSVACEMACLPQTQTGVCCPQQAQQLMGHCEHPNGSSLMALHDCNHTQDRGGASLAGVPVSIHMMVMHTSVASLPSSSLQPVHALDRAQHLFLNKPPNLPLRI